MVEGLDTGAEVRLNGVQVLSAANVHRRWRVDVTNALKAGKTRSGDITFVRRCARRRRAGGADPRFPVPYREVSGRPHANMLRKQQYDFGWDWNIALGGFEVSGAIRLESAGPRIGDVLVEQVHSKAGPRFG